MQSRIYPQSRRLRWRCRSNIYSLTGRYLGVAIGCQIYLLQVRSANEKGLRKVSYNGVLIRDQWYWIIGKKGKHPGNRYCAGRWIPADGLAAGR